MYSFQKNTYRWLHFLVMFTASNPFSLQHNITALSNIGGLGLMIDSPGPTLTTKCRELKNENTKKIFLKELMIYSTFSDL